MKWALLILGAVGALGSPGCTWRQPQPAYGAYPAPAASYAPAYAAPPCQPVQQQYMPVQAAPACSCY